ncbi:TraI/MobA(P) family conjugative relaxase (plasmid) [Pseudomonas sp. HR96]|uniref:TraI/MobA(P) family conjugative relaxase n=1 Tax=Pseudomonas sp. HR96 TaxID=1027966 RepID=UPI002A766621|nr:TraI/MobA(P) family conjugative relaxase [Pseudomonas sp. HR96]WPP02491.1 TraI/MobA(P) family conjugative relaxase [Pseudomonas sp. HR96]
MNVIIPPKRGDKGSSFNRLVSYISDRTDKPRDDDELTSTARSSQSRTQVAMFDRLVDYVDRNEGDERAVVVTDVFPDGRQRVISGGVSCETNCFSWETAAAEMNMVAAQSPRCVDPVYHFILSWRENEAPTDAQIFECAQYCIRQVGMEGHQYVTAVHQDTDNTHCHVAVNRVNPVTYKAANLWNDADKLQKSCRVLERKYGFIQDNGSWEWGVNDQLVRAPYRFTSAPRDAVPLQVYSNTESLYHYAVDQVRDPISKLLETNEISWEKAHRTLHDRGLGLREQGDGLVVYDYLRPQTSPVVKASSVHPALTKMKLERHIGKYQGRPSFATLDFDDSESHILMQSQYKPQFELRDKGVRFERRQERAEARLDLKLRYQRYREAWEKPDLNVARRQREIADHYRALKASVRQRHRDPNVRKLMYRVAEFERMKAMAELRIQLRHERQDLADKGQARALPYRAWVEQQALAGDVAAVSQLRGFAYREKRQQRRAAQQPDRVILCGTADDSAILDESTHATVLRRSGTIDYLRDGVLGVRDTGDLIHVAPPFEDYGNVENFDLAVGLAALKSRDRLHIMGRQEFIERAIESMHQVNRQFPQHRLQPTDAVQRQQLEELHRSNAIGSLQTHYAVQPRISPSKRPRAMKPPCLGLRPPCGL